MAKRKKKPNQDAQRKIQQAQHRNEFYRKLKYICSLIDDRLFEDLHHDPEYLLRIYLFRGASLKITADPKYNIPRRVLDYFEKYIKSFLTTQQMEIVRGKPTISYADYHYVGMSLDYFLRKDHSPFPGKERLADFIDEKKRDRVDEYCRGLENFAWQLSIIHGNIGGELLKIKFKSFFYEEKWDFRMQQQVILETVRLERREVRTGEGTVRQAVRVGFIPPPEYADDDGIKELSIAPSRFDITGHFAELPHPVYIQRHALARLDERIGCVNRGIVQQDVILSLLQGKIIRNPAGKFLVEFLMMNKKAGYLLVEITGGIILIRTFLFLTNNGTPEGKKLEELTGLQKLDKTYLAIDNLNSLVNSDILKNEGVCEIFRKAGCESLLELCRNLNDSPLWDHPENEIPIAGKLWNYLKNKEGTQIEENL